MVAGIFSCESVNEIWDCLKMAHERTKKVKESKVDILTTQYENFQNEEGETIHYVHTKHSFIINELRIVGEPINTNKQVRKALYILLKSWGRIMEVLPEAKVLKVSTMDALI